MFARRSKHACKLALFPPSVQSRGIRSKLVSSAQGSGHLVGVQQTLPANYHSGIVVEKGECAARVLGGESVNEMFAHFCSR